MCWALCLALLQACSSDAPEPKPDSGLPELPELVAGPVDRVGEVRAPREIQLFLVGEVRGEIEPCGCPTLPYGGFVRRQALLAQVSGLGIPTFHLDAGESLVKGLILTDAGAMKDRAELLAELMEDVAVDAWVPGPSDLAPAGLKGLKALFPAGTTPLTSATWIDQEGEPHFPPSIVLSRDGLTLGVVGLSRRPTSPEQRAIVGWRDPVDAAREAVGALPKDLDLVIALSNLPNEDNDRVAAEVAGLAAVLSTAGAQHDQPRAASGAPVVEVPGRGRYVTLLRTWLGSTAGQPLALETTRSKDLKRYDQSRVALRRMVQSGQADPTAQSALEGRVQTALAALTSAAQGHNLAVHDLRPLGAGLDSEVPVSARIARYKRSVLREALAVETAEVEERGPHYATASVCVGCHRPQFARWTFTSHAKAHDTLKSRNEAENPECLGCHTLGFGEEGGFGELTPFRLSQYGGVQCEACHGMLAGHPEEDDVRPTPVGPQTCLRCHDPANSPQFDYDVYLRSVHCPIGDEITPP